MTNLPLIRLGYPPAIVRKADRTRYLQNLRPAPGGDPVRLGEFLARAIIDTLVGSPCPLPWSGPTGALGRARRHDTERRALRPAADRAPCALRRKGASQRSAIKAV